MNLQDILHAARRVIEAKSERPTERPLRDIDGWSDQAEVAYYEEICAKRA